MRVDSFVIINKVCVVSLDTRLSLSSRASNLPRMLCVFKCAVGASTRGLLSIVIGVCLSYLWIAGRCLSSEFTAGVLC